MKILVLLGIVLNVTHAFNYYSPKTNITESLKTNKTISLTSDFEDIKNQFEKGSNETS